MKKSLLIGSIAAGAALITAGSMAAEAKGPGGPGRGGWERMDTNGDGKLTADEMSAKSESFIAAADADGDGAVTQEEAKAFHKAKREQMRAAHNPDKNGDGVVDRTEYVTAAQDRFDRLDKDGDGVLSESEMDRRQGRRFGRGEKKD